MFQHFDLRLSPPEVERRFREISLDSDKRKAAAIFMIAALFHLSSIPSDYMLLGRSEEFFWVLGIRCVGIVFPLAAHALVRRTKDVALFDATVFAWATYLCGSIVTANALLPANYTVHVAWDVLLTLGAYAAIPLPFARQLFVAAIISIGNIILFAGHKIYAYESTFSDLVLAFFCANLVGGFAAWEMQRWRRSLFVSFEREKAAKEGLEKAQQEIRTLRGIISICASCKKVRTDEGSWRQVEAYVREHSEAEFSHSICPQCSEALYGESD